MEPYPSASELYGCTPPLAAGQAFPAAARFSLHFDLLCCPAGKFLGHSSSRLLIGGDCDLLCQRSPCISPPSSRLLHTSTDSCCSSLLHCHNYGRDYRRKPSRLLRCHSRRYAPCCTILDLGSLPLTLRHFERVPLGFVPASAHIASLPTFDD